MSSNATNSILSDAQKEIILLISDDKENEELILASILEFEDGNKQVIVANSFNNARDFHVKLEPTIVIFNIFDLAFHRRILNFFSKVKTIERYMSISKKNGDIALELLENKIDDILFTPFDQYGFREKLMKFERLHFEKIIAKITIMEEGALNEYRKEFYFKRFEKIKVYQCRTEMDFHLYVETKKHSISMLHNRFVNKHYFNLEKFSLIVNILLENFFTASSSIREENVHRFALSMFNEFGINRPEDILVIIYNEIITRLLYKHKRAEWVVSFTDTCRLLCQIDIRQAALAIKYEVQERVQITTRNLHESVIYVLMNNTSHHLQKHISLISLNCSLLRELRDSLLSEHQEIEKLHGNNKKVDKIHSYLMSKNFQFPLADLQKFTAKIIKLFRNFKDELHSKLHSNDIEHLFIFMCSGFTDCNAGIKITIENSLSDCEFEINENIVIAVLYAILENAKEAGATNILILLESNHTNLFIRVSNNGHVIQSEIADLMFEKHFGCKSKKIKGHYGLGLSVARSMMESIDSELYYDKFTKQFIIQIPQNL